MNLLADEGVDRAVVDRLRDDGHDVLYVAELSPRITDDEVLQQANDRGSTNLPTEAKPAGRFGAPAAPAAERLSRRQPVGMTRYDPLRAPDPEEWLALDERERIALVAAYHRRARARLPNLQLHAAIHAVVENQLAERIAVVQETLERLRAEGLDRHEAIHAIGSVVAEHLWKAMNERLRGPDLEEGYFRRLEALTASDWLKGPG